MTTMTVTRCDMGVCRLMLKRKITLLYDCSNTGAIHHSTAFTSIHHIGVSTDLTGNRFTKTGSSPGSWSKQGLNSFLKDFCVPSVSWSKHFTRSVLCLKNNSRLRLPSCYTLNHCHGYHTTSRTFINKDDKHDVRTKPPWRVVFFGTDVISLSTLKALHENLTSSKDLVDNLEVATVQSTNKKYLPVERFAMKHSIPIHNWPTLDKTKRFDVGVLVSFGHLVPASIINMFPYGIINVHPSLLPRWRGASPIFHTVLNGDTETGVSITELRPKHFDVGPLLMQKRVPVPSGITTGELTSQLADIGAEMLLESLKDLPNLERMEHDQTEQGVTYAHKVDPMIAGCIDWENQTPVCIYCQFKALKGYGNSRLMSHLQNGETLSFTEMIDPQMTAGLDEKDILYKWGDFLQAKPGCIALHRKQKWLLVTCKDGIVGFSKVVIRSRLTGDVFYYGFCNHKDVQMTFRSEDNYLNKYIYMNRVPK